MTYVLQSAPLLSAPGFVRWCAAMPKAKAVELLTACWPQLTPQAVEALYARRCEFDGDVVRVKDC